MTDESKGQAITIERRPRNERLFGILAGMGIVLLLDSLILKFAGTNVNAWWFFVSATVGFVTAALAWQLYEILVGRIRRDIWIPAEFAGFALTTYAIALGSNDLRNFIQNIFDTPTISAKIVFVILNLVPVPLLFWVFHLRRESRLKVRSSASSHS